MPSALLHAVQVRSSPCACAWPDACDSQGGGMPPTRKALEAAAAAAERAGGTLNPVSSPVGAGADSAGHGADPERPVDPGSFPAKPPDAGEVTGGAAALRNGFASGYGASTPSAGSPHDALSGAVASCSAAGAAQSSCDTDSAAAPARARGMGEGPCPDTALPSGAQGVREGSGSKPAASPADAGGMREGSGPGLDPWVGERCEAEALRLEAAHVHSVYEAIAAHFSATRFAIWPKARWRADSCPGMHLKALGTASQCMKNKHTGRVLCMRSLWIMAALLWTWSCLSCRQAPGGSASCL